jgi:dethiobiotin synthase
MTSSPLGQCLFVSASDTEVGKTVVTAALALCLGDVAVMKLVQAGAGDREYYQQVLPQRCIPAEVNPLFFSAPLAPPLAAQREGRRVDLAYAWQQLTQLRQRVPRVLIEGAGGLGSPVTWEWTTATLCAQWRLPTLLVIPVRLGAIGVKRTGTPDTHAATGLGTGGLAGTTNGCACLGPISLRGKHLGPQMPPTSSDGCRTRPMLAGGPCVNVRLQPCKNVVKSEVNANR